MNNFIKYFQKHIDGMCYFRDNLIDSNLSEFINFINISSGNLFFTGVGKNGHIAAKAASTFNSMSIRVFYINPVDAVHGDMGLIQKNDTILAISKSGNTEELVWFLKNASKITKNIFLIHSNHNNECLKYCKSDLYVPIKSEADNLNKIPTVSILLYTAILQSICCCISQKNNFTIEQLLFNHPGGSIGKTKI